MSDFWLPPSMANGPSRDEAVHAALRQSNRSRVLSDEPEIVAQMRKNRRISALKARGTMSRTAGGADVSFATARPRDPMFYWEQNNIPWDIHDPKQLLAIRDYCWKLYLTHPVLASAIDIYSKYPLTGMELSCKDQRLTDFYTDLFFDQLKYESYLKKVGRSYWTVGEAWPFGSFNETMGVWEDDELLNPSDIEVERSPFLKEPRFKMRLPKSLRDVLVNREPRWEYEKLIKAYPELRHFTREDVLMPVSNILLRQLKFEADPFHERGIPLLMRGFRAVMQEEMLNAAQDAIADRLYTPLVVAKLGASATDLGTSIPWVPTDDDIADFEDALDIALASDFRLLVHNFALDIGTVFGRETMPNFDADYDRLTERELQVFGLSKTMLSGAEGGQTYAADALNRDLISQLLTDFQNIIKDFFRERALVVAEAQEHFDYEERGGKRYPVMEEVLETDPESGEMKIVEQPKLLVPEMRIKAMNMQDDAQFHQLIEALRESGVPISMKTRLVNVDIDLGEEIETTAAEQVEQAVKAQETRRETYLALKGKGLPIPEELRADFEPKAANAPSQQDEELPIPTIGLVQPAPTTGLAPTQEDIAAMEQAEQGGQQPPPGQPPMQPRNRMMQRQRPPESDEMRAGMPRQTPVAVASAASDGDPTGDPSGIPDPKHIGLRRWAGLDKDKPLPETA